MRPYRAIPDDQDGAPKEPGASWGGELVCPRESRAGDVRAFAEGRGMSRAEGFALEVVYEVDLKG